MSPFVYYLFPSPITDTIKLFASMLKMNIQGDNFTASQRNFHVNFTHI